MLKNKYLKKFLFLLIICLFLLLIYNIVQIYAVFYSKMDANVALENGVWNIKVNGTKISTGIETQFTVEQIETTRK